MEVQERARRLARAAHPCVDGEGGCHNRLLSLAIALGRGLRLSDGAVLEVLVSEYNPRCVPPWSQKELEHKVAAARSFGIDQADGYLLGDGCGGVTDFGGASAVAAPSARKKPVFVPESLRRVSARLVERVDRAWLADRSPVAPHAVSAEGFLQEVLSPGESVCVIEQKFNDKGTFMVRRGASLEIRECENRFLKGESNWQLELRAEALEKFPRRACENGFWWLPQPVSGEPAENAEGKWSWRSEQNVTAWRWMVLESDVVGWERAWVCVLAQLPVAIGAIYSSGGKSVHALLRVDAQSKEEWDEMKGEMAPVFVELGADPRALSAVRLSRVPQLWRGRNLQALHYFDPECGAEPIVDAPPVRDVREETAEHPKLRRFYKLDG